MQEFFSKSMKNPYYNEFSIEIIIESSNYSFGKKKEEL